LLAPSEGEASQALIAKKLVDEWNKVTDKDADQFEALQSLVEKMDSGGVRLHASDFPRTSRSECLTVVTLTTEPPIICHASADETTESREAATNELLSKIQSLASGDNN
jgi:hypothetical protein